MARAVAGGGEPVELSARRGRSEQPENTEENDAAVRQARRRELLRAESAATEHSKCPSSGDDAGAFAARAGIAGQRVLAGDRGCSLAIMECSLTISECSLTISGCSLTDFRVLADDFRVLADDLRVLADDLRVLADKFRVLADDFECLLTLGVLVTIRVLADDLRVLADDLQVLADHFRVLADDLRLALTTSGCALTELQSAPGESRAAR